MPSKAALCFDVEASSVGNSRQKLGFMFCVLRAWPTLDPRLFAGSVFQKHITEEASVQHAKPNLPVATPSRHESRASKFCVCLARKNREQIKAWLRVQGSVRVKEPHTFGFAPDDPNPYGPCSRFLQLVGDP